MNHFPELEYNDDELLFCEIPLRKIVLDFSTPVYVYSEKIIKENIFKYQKGIQNHNVLLCYSVKANSNIAILKIISETGAGADIVSGGELYRCKKASIPTHKIVFSGVGKSEEEIKFALEEKILLFSVESYQELLKINDIAGKMQTIAPVSFRINPNIDPKSHPYISTGLRENKFGIPADEFKSMLEMGLNLKNVDIKGIGYHIGSQITDIHSSLEAAEKSKEFIKIFNHYKKLEYLDIGGGLGIRYKDENPPDPEEFIKTILSYFPKNEFQILIEPGRSIVGLSGILISRVLYTKKSHNKFFYIVDSAMNDLIRPTLYNAHHEIFPLKFTHYQELLQGKHLIADVVGPICESGDYIAKNRKLPLLEQDDYIIITASGAYGFVMSSQYNSRPRAAEVLITEKGEIQLIRERETYEDLILKERY